MKKKFLVLLTAIGVLLMSTGSLAYTPSASETFPYTYALGDQHDYTSMSRYSYSVSNYTCLELIEYTADPTFLLTFKVYDGASAVTSSGSLQYAQSRSSLYQYQSTSTAGKQLLLRTNYSKYCRFGQYIVTRWYIK